MTTNKKRITEINLNHNVVVQDIRGDYAQQLNTSRMLNLNLDFSPSRIILYAKSMTVSNHEYGTVNNFSIDSKYNNNISTSCGGINGPIQSDYTIYIKSFNNKTLELIFIHKQYGGSTRLETMTLVNPIHILAIE